MARAAFGVADSSSTRIVDRPRTDYLIRCGGQTYPRHCSACRLSFEEREEINRGLAAGRSPRAIAAALGRSAWTVSREVAGNGGRRRSRAATANQLASARTELFQV